MMLKMSTKGERKLSKQIDWRS